MQPSQEPTIIFFGTSQFGAIILEKLIQANMKPVLVVTTPDKPVGRKQILSPSPVKVLAQKYGLPLLQPEKLGLAELNLAKPSFPHPELFIVAAYGKILPKEILDIPTHGTLNVHPSLLPKYRGPSPVQTAILNGDQETGVTIMLADEKIDHGSIIANTKYQILDTKYAYEELHDKLAEMGADLLIKTIPEFVQGKIKPIPQDDSKAVYTKILTREDGKINWENTAQHIDRQVRAFTPWPGTYTKFHPVIRRGAQSNDRANSKPQILKILRASVLKTDNKLGRKPGQVFLTLDKKIAIQTADGALAIEVLQLEGKKPTSAKDFLLGYKDFIGTILC